jgi:protein involved in polysaccharide export with SLBB domain
MTKRKRISVYFLVMILCYLQLGCEGPESIGRFRATPVTNIILEDLGVIDEEPDIFSGARDPLPRDMIPDETEYVIGPGDILDISIYELFGPGQEWMGRKQVSEVGRITIPEIGTFRASGKTELELTETIQNLLSPRIVKDPTVTVVVVGPRKKVYSIAGAVAAPGPYVLNESDFRISRALASAGGIPQTNADYAYVIRTRGFWPGEGDIGEMAPVSEDQDIWSPAETTGKRYAIPSDFERPFPDIEESVSPVTEETKVLPPPVEPVQPPPVKPPPVKPKREQDELLESITPMSVVTPPAVGIQGGNFYGEVKINFNFPSAGTMANGTPSPPPSETSPPAESKPSVVTPPTGVGAEIKGELPSPSAAKPEPPGVSKRSQSLSGWRLVRRGSRFELVPEEGAAPLELGYEEKASPRWDDNIPAEPERGGFVLPKGEPAHPGLEMGWDDEGLTIPQHEVIKVDLKKLRGGDWTQNIVIRPGDDIQIPYNATGIYSVMGQVARPGAYSLAGQRLTLKQVISTAGPLTALAWPSRCEIIRRLGENKEVTHLVNLEKLFAGTAPDVFIKPNDIINVGSHPVSRWAAVIRQSFRTTYGFGFVYDRNFADKDIGR